MDRRIPNRSFSRQMGSNRHLAIRSRTSHCRSSRSSLSSLLVSIHRLSSHCISSRIRCCIRASHSHNRASRCHSRASHCYSRASRVLANRHHSMVGSLVHQDHNLSSLGRPSLVYLHRDLSNHDLGHHSSLVLRSLVLPSYRLSMAHWDDRPSCRLEDLL